MQSGERQEINHSLELRKSSQQNLTSVQFFFVYPTGLLTRSFAKITASRKVLSLRKTHHTLLSGSYGPFDFFRFWLDFFGAGRGAAEDDVAFVDLDCVFPVAEAGAFALVEVPMFCFFCGATWMVVEALGVATEPLLGVFPKLFVAVAVVGLESSAAGRTLMVTLSLGIIVVVAPNWETVEWKLVCCAMRVFAVFENFMHKVGHYNANQTAIVVAHAVSPH